MSIFRKLLANQSSLENKTRFTHIQFANLVAGGDLVSVNTVQIISVLHYPKVGTNM